MQRVTDSEELHTALNKLKPSELKLWLVPSAVLFVGQKHLHKTLIKREKNRYLCEEVALEVVFGLAADGNGRKQLFVKRYQEVGGSKGDNGENNNATHSSKPTNYSFTRI